MALGVVELDTIFEFVIDGDVGIPGRLEEMIGIFYFDLAVILHLFTDF